MASVLVVDDDEAIRDTLYDLLSEEYACQTADSTERALARLAADSYDVILTDISMPGLSGLELLGHVLQKYPQTPVIVISGISDREHAEGLIKLGAFDYLLKPFRLEVVEKAVKRAVEHNRRLTAGFEGATEKVQDRPESDDGAASDWRIIKDNSSA
jgi:DNA-binding NtrC family response regulator